MHDLSDEDLARIGQMFKPETKDTNPKDLAGQTKAQLWLTPPAAKISLAEALTDGAKKYGPYNWREKGVRASVYLSAAERHILSWLDGEDVASDSGVHHLGHAMACYAILLDAISQGNVVDDRPIKGNASKRLAEVHQRNEEKIPKEPTKNTTYPGEDYSYGGSKPYRYNEFNINKCNQQ